MLRYDSGGGGGGSGSEVDESNDDFGQYLSTLKVSLRAESTASDDWGVAAAVDDSGNAATTAAALVAMSPEKSGNNRDLSDPDSPPSCGGVLSPAGGGGQGEVGNLLVTPARRPVTTPPIHFVLCELEDIDAVSDVHTSVSSLKLI